MKRSVQFNDEKVEGTEVSFGAINEEWDVYRLNDGTTLKFKSVVANIVRLDDKYNDVGDPIYLVDSRNVVTCTEIAEHLRKGGQTK